MVSSSALHCSKEHRLEIQLKKLQVTWEFLSFPWLQWLILFLPCKVFALGTTMSQFKSTRCLILLGKNIVWLHSILDWNSKKKIRSFTFHVLYVKLLSHLIWHTPWTILCYFPFIKRSAKTKIMGASLQSFPPFLPFFSNVVHYQPQIPSDAIICNLQKTSLGNKILICTDHNTNADSNCTEISSIFYRKTLKGLFLSGEVTDIFCWQNAIKALSPIKCTKILYSIWF